MQDLDVVFSCLFVFILCVLIVIAPILFFDIKGCNDLHTMGYDSFYNLSQGCMIKTTNGDFVILDKVNEINIR